MSNDYRKARRKARKCGYRIVKTEDGLSLIEIRTEAPVLIGATLQDIAAWIG